MENVEMERREKPLFDMTINLGHILTFIGFIVTGFIAFQSLDKRVVVLEQTIAYQARRDEAQDSIMKDNRNDIKEALKEIHSSLEKLSDKVESVVKRK